jgi:hypothetical protein
MISEDKILLKKAYSIDLYAINLNEKFVPESHALAPSGGVVSYALPKLGRLQMI